MGSGMGRRWTQWWRVKYATRGVLVRSVDEGWGKTYWWRGLERRR